MWIWILLLIAFGLLLFLYFYTRDETRYEKDFNEYIERDLGVNNLSKEISLNEQVSLDDQTELVVYGINHYKTMGTQWMLFINKEQICPLEINKYWIQRFSTWPERDAFKVKATFKLEEVVKTNRKFISMRGFLIPISGKLNFTVYEDNKIQ